MPALPHLMRGILAAALLALAAIGLHSRESLEETTRGPLVGHGVVLVVVVALGVVLIGMATLVLLFRALRGRRRKPPEDEHIVEAMPAYTRWSRPLAVGAALVAVTVPALLLVFIQHSSTGSARSAPTITAALPTESAAAPTTTSTGPGQRLGSWPLWVLLGLIAMLVVTALMVRLINNRKPPLVPPQAEPPNPDVLGAALLRAGEALGEPGEPRAAVVPCYVAMERGFATAGGAAAPRGADTSTEVLRRAVDAGLVSPGPAGRLTSLFWEARYSRHRITEADRRAAERALHAVRAELDSR